MTPGDWTALGQVLKAIGLSWEEAQDSCVREKTGIAVWPNVFLTWAGSRTNV